MFLYHHTLLSKEAIKEWQKRRLEDEDFCETLDEFFGLKGTYALDGEVDSYVVKK